MLDGILGRGFTAKCKSLIKMTKSRIDMIRRKRNATQKFLKKDIADLLANGLDINAYGRAEGLLAELTISSCYDFIEQSCDFVLMHLSIVQKLRECPEDCREAVSSLMFAAARFSDLPELRDLRQMFQERYGNSLEHFENREFVEKLASNPSTLEKKVQLMQDIAAEFSIRWDAKAFEKRMSRPPVFAQGQNEKYGPSNNTDGKTKLSSGNETVPSRDEGDTSYKERFELVNGGHPFHGVNNGTVSKRNEHNVPSRQEVCSNGYEKIHGKEEKILKINGNDSSFRGRQDFAVGNHETQNGKEDATLKVRSGSSSMGRRLEHMGGESTPSKCRENSALDRDYLKFLPHGQPDVSPSCAGSQLKHGDRKPSFGNNHEYANLFGKAREDENQKWKTSNALPPPYVKSNSRLKNIKREANVEPSQFGYDDSCISNDHLHCTRSKSLKSGHSDDERQVVVGPPRTKSHEKEYVFDVKIAGDPRPKPRSLRRKHSKARFSDDVGGDVEDAGVLRRRLRSRRKDEKRGLQLLVEEEQQQNDYEERRIDELLIHYSTKPSNFEPGNLRRKSRSHHHGHDMSAKTVESPLNGIRDKPEEKSDVGPSPDMVPLPARSVSLPHKQIGPSEVNVAFIRAASFQQDRSNGARHVHPKLPDYDDLAARFAALKGR